jgi:hypothetical protein
MKYVLLFCMADEEWAAAPAAERDRVMAEVGEWWGRHAAAGKLVGGEQLMPATAATTVRFDGSRPIVTDGPYIEAKETVGGFALLDVADLDEALAIAKTWPAGSTVELRPVVDQHDGS